MATGHSGNSSFVSIESTPIGFIFIVALYYNAAHIKLSISYKKVTGVTFLCLCNKNVRTIF